MSALDEYDKNRNGQGLGTTTLTVYADAMRAELLAAIAELEAELAERDRMLRLAYGHPEWDEHWYQGWLAALRARAEKGK